MKPRSYWLTRFLILRLLGLVYCMAFLCLVNQALPLIGEEGLLPAGAFLGRVEAHYGSGLQGFLQLPSIFWLHLSDGFLLVMGWAGLALSIALLFGFANAISLAVLWAVYLSFLNWLTIVPALACFDDSLLRRVLPRRLVLRAERAASEARPSRPQLVAAWCLVAMVVVLSYEPVLNLLSERQVMNTSFNRLHLVNTYGAFGSVGRERNEIVFEGTSDAEITGRTQWREYEFKCKPGDPKRRPPLVSPYHHRLDWQIWFAAMSSFQEHPWTLHFVWKLLQNDRGTLGLLAGNPFPDEPPRFIRAQLYRYEFAPLGDPDGAWWKRTWIGEWLPPLSAEHPGFRRAMALNGWLSGER